MYRLLVTTVSLAMLSGVLWAESRPSLPRRPAPYWALASMDGDEHIVIRRVLTGDGPFAPQPLPRNTPRFDDKKSVRFDVRDDEEQVELLTVKKRRMSCNGVKAFSPSGKKIDSKQLAELLKEEVVVLISSDGNIVDPFYLQVVKPETLILILPAPKPVGRAT